MITIRRFGVDPNAISMILLSHLHGDHFAGIPFFILDARFISKRTEPLLIAGPPGTQARVEAAMEILFPGSSGVRQAFPVTIVELEPERPRTLDGITVTPYVVVHACGDPPLALRIACEGKVVTYSGDTEWTDALLPAAHDADLLIVESSSFDKALKYHLSFQTIMAHRDELRAKRIVVTHMGPEMLARLGTLPCEHAEDGKIVEL